MKKLVAMMMVILMVVSLTVTAQAEVRCTSVGTEGDAYYAVYESDSGETFRISVTEAEYYKLVCSIADEVRSKERKENPRWYEKAWDKITFWN